MNSKNNGGRPLDPYELQYQQQLEQFTQLAGDTDDDIGLDPGSIDDAFAGYEQQTQQQYPLPRNYGQPNGGAVYGRPQQPYREQGETSGRGRQPYREQGARRREQQSDRGQQPYRPAPQRPARQNTEPPPRPQKNKKRSSSRNRPPKKQYEREQLQFGSHHEEHTRAKRHPIQRFFSTVVILVLVMFLALNCLLYYYVCLVNQRGRGERAVTGASMKSADVTNILLIGSDTRSPEEFGRTDSMILLSVNSSKKTVTMTSFMRDMYVEIVGNDNNGEKVDVWDKLNSAYVYGGAELLMDTIQYNFDIAVDDYVYVDFFAFIDIVDSIGGIEVEVTDEEAEGMEDPQREQNKYLGQASGTDLLTHGGKLNLNGNQALAYARLRYVGNADFQRTERQREVIGKIIDKVKGSNPLVMNKFAKTSLSKLSTNMSRAKMMTTAYKAIFSLNYEVKSLRLPAEGAYSYGWHGDQSTLDVDIDACRALLRSEIYE